MSYEWAVKGGTDTDGWATDLKIVVVAVGSLALEEITR